MHPCHTKRMANALQTAQASKVEDAHGRAVQASGTCTTCSHLSIQGAALQQISGRNQCARDKT